MAARPTVPPVVQILQPWLNNADIIDIKTITARSPLRQFIAGLLAYQPAWVSLLYGVRRIMVRFIGMRQAGIPQPPHWQPAEVPMQPGQAAGFFRVVQATEEHFWAVEAADVHLTALLAVVVEPGTRPDQPRLFYVVTIVHYHDWRGPLYFNVIRPFHHLVVGGMMRHAARSLPATAPVAAESRAP